MHEKDPAGKGKTPPERETPPKGPPAPEEKPTHIQGFEIVGENPDGTYKLAGSHISMGSIDEIIDARSTRVDRRREAGDTRPTPPNETEAQAIERTVHDDRGGRKTRGTMERIYPVSLIGRIQEWHAGKRSKKLFERSIEGYWRDRSINGYGEAPNVARSVAIASTYENTPEIIPEKVRSRVEEALARGDKQAVVDIVEESTTGGSLSAAENLRRAEKSKRTRTDHTEDPHPFPVKAAKRLEKHERKDHKTIAKLSRKSDKWANEETLVHKAFRAPENITRASADIKDRAKLIARKSPVKIRKKNRAPRQP